MKVAGVVAAVCPQPQSVRVRPHDSTRNQNVSDLPNRVEAGDYFSAFMSNPSPYRTIAVASTFSPRFKQVLAEAKRIRDRFVSDLHVIYVGERNEETAKKFGDAFAQLQLPDNSTIHYEQGEPADAILCVLVKHKIDMIVAGALEKEIVLHRFLGNVARRLVREAACSVMLFTRPAAEPKPLRRIVFVADYSDHALQALKTTLPLALPRVGRLPAMAASQRTTKTKKPRWKDSCYQRVRPTSRSKPAASAATLGWLRQILFNRSKQTCW